MKNRIALTLLGLASTVLMAGTPSNWPQGAEVPVWWPNQVGLHPDSTIEKVDHALERGLPDLDTLVKADGASVESIVDWYRESLADAGWEVWKTRKTAFSTRITSQNKELDKRIIIQVFTAEDAVRNKAPFPRVKITVYTTIPVKK